jgi:hypothetical protein
MAGAPAICRFARRRRVNLGLAAWAAGSFPSIQALDDSVEVASDLAYLKEAPEDQRPGSTGGESGLRRAPARGAAGETVKGLAKGQGGRDACSVRSINTLNCPASWTRGREGDAGDVAEKNQDPVKLLIADKISIKRKFLAP